MKLKAQTKESFYSPVTEVKYKIVNNVNSFSGIIIANCITLFHTLNIELFPNYQCTHLKKKPSVIGYR